MESSSPRTIGRTALALHSPQSRLRSSSQGEPQVNDAETRRAAPQPEPRNRPDEQKAASLLVFGGKIERIAVNARHLSSGDLERAAHIDGEPAGVVRAARRTGRVEREGNRN